VLAADSAVTLRAGKRTKVFNTANKLHLLVEDAPVGVMVSGSPDLLQVPWETIIKLYRRERDGKVFPSLKRHADDLFKFIRERVGVYFPAEVQRDAIRARVESVYWKLQSLIEKWIKSAEKQQRPPLESIRAFTDTTVDDFCRDLRQYGFLDGWGPSEASVVRTEYESDFARTRDEVFDKRYLSAGTADLLISIAVDLIIRRHPFGEKSQVVVAGYGERELFPSLKVFHVHGVAMNRLLYAAAGGDAITHEARAWIGQFAQGGMVSTFMNGIDPVLRRHVDELVEAAFVGLPEAVLSAMPDLTDETHRGLGEILRWATSNLAEELGQGIVSYMLQYHARPVLETIALIPKEEIAQVAEALVNLISMKRRVMMMPETVGGPVDVAVITKGDGFVWVRRKHYFDPALNPRVIGKYSRDRGTKPTSNDRKELE